jgi:hypothetical protein
MNDADYIEILQRIERDVHKISPCDNSYFMYRKALEEGIKAIRERGSNNGEVSKI